jgi:hypothetical protein
MAPKEGGKVVRIISEICSGACQWRKQMPVLWNIPLPLPCVGTDSRVQLRDMDMEPIARSWRHEEYKVNYTAERVTI